VSYTSVRIRLNGEFLSANTNSHQRLPFTRTRPDFRLPIWSTVANLQCINMTIPERPPISGLVEISLRMDLTTNGFFLSVSVVTAVCQVERRCIGRGLST